MRRQLDKKASNHAKFDAFQLEPQNQKEEEHQVNSEICTVVKRTLSDLEKQSTDFKEEQNESVIDFAKLTAHPGFKKHAQNQSKFVLLGLWRRQKDNEDLVCHSQYKVDNPFLIESRESDSEIVLADFLHLGDKNEVFFFQRYN